LCVRCRHQAPLFFCTSGKETIENLKISRWQLAPCQENRIKRQQKVSSAECMVLAPNAGFLLALMPSYCRFRQTESFYSQSVSVSVPQDKIRGSAIATGGSGRSGRASPRRRSTTGREAPPRQFPPPGCESGRQARHEPLRPLPGCRPWRRPKRGPLPPPQASAADNKAAGRWCGGRDDDQWSSQHASPRASAAATRSISVDRFARRAQLRWPLPPRLTHTRSRPAPALDLHGATSWQKPLYSLSAFGQHGSAMKEPCTVVAAASVALRPWSLCMATAGGGQLILGMSATGTNDRHSSSACHRQNNGHPEREEVPFRPLLRHGA